MQLLSQLHLLNLRDFSQRNTLNTPEMLNDQNCRGLPRRAVGCGNKDADVDKTE